MEPVFGALFRIAMTYVVVLTLVILSGKRTLRDVSPQNFAVAIMLGDMMDDVIWGEIPMVQGFLGLSTIVLLQILVSIAAFKSRRINALFGCEPVLVFRNGSYDRKGMRRERVSEEEIHSFIREHGEEHLSDIEEILIEPTGQASVRLKEGAKPAQKKDLPRRSEQRRGQISTYDI